MKKWTATILSLLTLAAISAPVAKTPSAPLVEANAAQSAFFSAPNDVATTEGFSAVADGRALYLFDEEKGGFWQKYVHGQEIAQIAFDGQGTLYFKDEHYDLYALNANDETTAAAHIADMCATFFLHGNNLYTSTLNLVKLHTADGSTTKYTLDGVYESFAFLDERLYAVKDDNRLYELTLSASTTATLLHDFTGTRQNLTAANGSLFSTDANGLYRYTLSDGTETQIDGEGYTALSARGDTLYAVKNKEIYTCAANTAAAPQKATDEFALPYMENIPTGSLKTDIREGTGDFTLVQTKPQALLVEVDFEGATDTLPVNGTVRKESLTALKLGETAGYALLAHRENAASPYKTYLAAKNGYSSLSTSEYAPAYEEAKSGYLTNAVSLYKYPHLGLPTVDKGERNEKILLLGEVKGLDCEYYKVRRGEIVGYIPKAYVNEQDLTPPETAQTVVGDRNAGKDGIWRMAYILLGTAVIGILIDLLILRKKNEE